MNFQIQVKLNILELKFLLFKLKNKGQKKTNLEYIYLIYTHRD